MRPRPGSPASCCQTYNSPPSSFDVVSDKEIPNGFPQIIQNPGMKVVEKGRNTVLVCEAGGDPNPTITWIKVGWRDRRGGSPISGQASVAQGLRCVLISMAMFQDTMPVVLGPSPGTGDKSGRRISMLQQGKLRGEQR